VGAAVGEVGGGEAVKWLVPYSGRVVAHLMRRDGVHDRLTCTGHYTNAAIAQDVKGAPRCKRCNKVAGAQDRRLALDAWRGGREAVR